MTNANAKSPEKVSENKISQKIFKCLDFMTLSNSYLVSTRSCFKSPNKSKLSEIRKKYNLSNQTENESRILPSRPRNRYEVSNDRRSRKISCRCSRWLTVERTQCYHIYIFPRSQASLCWNYWWIVESSCKGKYSTSRTYRQGPCIICHFEIVDSGNLACWIENHWTKVWCINCWSSIGKHSYITADRRKNIILLSFSR